MVDGIERWEDLGGIGKRKNMIKTYYMKKNSIK